MGRPLASTTPTYLSPTVVREWAELPISATKTRFPASSSRNRSPIAPPAPTPPFREFTPRSLSDSESISSSAPSPCPSEASETSWIYTPAIMVEIEEIGDDVDSGIELLQGEFEEAPEITNQSDQEDEDENMDDEHRTLLLKLRKFWDHHNPSFLGSSTSTSRKRTYAESLDGSDYDGGYDSGNSDSESGGRIRRRKLAPLHNVDRGNHSRMSTPEFFADMEL